MGFALPLLLSNLLAVAWLPLEAAAPWGMGLAAFAEAGGDALCLMQVSAKKRNRTVASEAMQHAHSGHVPSSGGPAAQVVVESEVFEFDSTLEFMDVSGYICGGQDEAAVYYPTGTGDHPLISMAMGLNPVMPAPGEPGDYGKLLPGLAARGYVVIAALSAQAQCDHQYVDQLHSITAMKSGKLRDKVAWSKGVGLLGHSMGGRSTVVASSMSGPISTHQIKAAVSLHGVEPQGSYAPQVPVFYGTGSNDDLVSPQNSVDMYANTNVDGRVLAIMAGATHYEPNTGHPHGQNRWTSIVANFFDCHLKYKNCEQIYNDRGPGVRMTEYKWTFNGAAGDIR